MLISEVINRLEELKKEHGDIPVYYATCANGYDAYEIGQLDFEEELYHPDYDHEDGEGEEICSSGILAG